MSENQSPVKLVLHELKLRSLEVKRVTQLTPRMVRVTLGGSELEGFITQSPDDHIKVFFPAAGETKPNLPTIGVRGIVWPEGVTRPVTRDYTPRHYDAETGELDIDFVLHGDGVASQWAASAQAGQSVGIAGPRGSHIVSYDYDWYLLVGDESALPTLSRRLEELPANAKVKAFIEVADESEVQPLTVPQNAEIFWVFRNGTAAGANKLLESAVRELEFPQGTYFAWIAGEVGMVRSVFLYLLNEKAATRQQIQVDGHWKYGVANHDHHEPIEA